METFCTEPLTIKENFQITFLPDIRKKHRTPIQPTYISFLNVPSEADEESLTQSRRHRILHRNTYLPGNQYYRTHTTLQFPIWQTN